MKTILSVLCVCVTAGLGCARAQAPATAPAPQVAGGGFQIGDRILLQVEGDSLLSKTFAVGPGPALTLPVIGAIPLTGVRRSDIEPYLSQQLARYLKEPVVHAKALINLSILGEVERPGFYAVSADIVLADALMQAGGPTREAKVAAMRIERSGKPLLAEDSLQSVLAHGLTVDQVGLRDGDRLVVPRLVQRDAESTWRILGVIVSIPVAIYGITRAFSAMRILSVVGARPNFMKLAPVDLELAKRPGDEHVIVHTGQHYVPEMSAAFFEELWIPAPDHHLGVGSGSHAAQTAAVMERLEPVLVQLLPDAVLVYGDVNSTLAAALVAAKLGLRVGHVEAGLRSGDGTML